MPLRAEGFCSHCGSRLPLPWRLRLPLDGGPTRGGKVQPMLRRLSGPPGELRICLSVFFAECSRKTSLTVFEAWTHWFFGVVKKQILRPHPQIQADVRPRNLHLAVWHWKHGDASLVSKLGMFTARGRHYLWGSLGCSHKFSVKWGSERPGRQLLSTTGLLWLCFSPSHLHYIKVTNRKP